MGKKKWTGRGGRRHQKKKEKHGQQFKSGTQGRQGFRPRGPLHEAKATNQSNANEDFHGRMTKFNLMEKDVGVTEYVGKTPGFNGVIKARFSDFQVNEIDLDGNVVKLTNTTLPTPPEAAADAAAEQVAMELLSQEVWDKLIQLSKTGRPADVEVNAESMTKEQRGMIHTTVKQKFGSSIVSSTITKDDKKFFKFTKFKKNTSNDYRTKWLWPGEYTHFVLYKQNLDSMTAASDLAQGLNANSKSISYAGTKDKRAKTTQWFCIRKRDPEKISKAADMKQNIHVGNFVFKDEPLKLGSLSGNRFRIALRHITHAESDIELSLQSLKENGFINYYGLQRFGNNSKVPTHQVGLALIKGQFKEACELILKPREGEQTFMKEIREHWWTHRDSAAALNLFYKNKNCIEMRLLAGFVRHGNKDFVNTLNNIPRNMLLLYLHSYQSLIWNEIASQRMKLGMQLMPGDLVFTDDKPLGVQSDIIDDENVLFDMDDDDEQEKPEEESVEDEVKVSVFKNMVKPLTADDIASGKYTIFDIVLPLPGHDISYPTNECGQWYADRLAKDELSSEKLKTKQKMYSLCGAYRKLLVKPTNLSWHFMKYKSETDDLILSDLDELRHIKAPISAEDGEFKALILDFCLPTSTYATMLLREVFKGDTSASYQIKLGFESISASDAEKRKLEESVDETVSKKAKSNDDSNSKISDEETKVVCVDEGKVNLTDETSIDENEKNLKVSDEETKMVCVDESKENMVAENEKNLKVSDDETKMVCIDEIKDNQIEAVLADDQE